MSGNTIHNLGGVSIQLWPFGQFFPVELPNSMGSWHKNWFYVSGLGDSLPAFYGGSPQCLNSWESLDDLSRDTKLLVAASAQLKENGLKGIHIMQTWVECRVLPLQAREELMCNNQGPFDPSRVSTIELGEEEVRCWLALLMGQEADKISMEVVVEAFHREAPPGEVTVSF